MYHHRNWRSLVVTCIPARRNTLCAEKQRRYVQFRRGTLITHKFNSHFKYVKHSVIISQPGTTSPVENYLKMVDWRLQFPGWMARVPFSITRMSWKAFVVSCPSFPVVLGTGSLLDKQQMTETPNRLLSAVLGALRRLHALQVHGTKRSHLDHVMVGYFHLIGTNHQPASFQP